MGRALLVCAVAAVLIVPRPQAAIEGRAEARPSVSQERTVKPQITSITPPEPARAGAPQIVLVNGEHFAEGLVLEVSAPDRRTQRLAGQDVREWCPTSFQVAVLLPRGGTYMFTVRNPDGVFSNSFPVKVPPAATAPVIERIEPASFPRNTSPQRITISGRNFAPGLSVTLIDPTGEVTVIRDGLGTVTPTSFTLDITLTVTGEYALLVTNPSTDVSNSMPITVTSRGGGRVH